MSGKKPPVPQLPIEDLVAIVEQARQGAIEPQQYAKLKAAIHTLALLQEELGSKKTSIERLKRMLFGASTEKTRAVLGENCTEEESAAGAKAGGEPDRADGGQRRKGHGRNGAADYPGAQKVKIRHPSLHHGQSCPACARGKVCTLEDAVRVRFHGMAPLRATVYECTRLRCALCGQVFTAPTPEGVGESKYDESAAATVGMLKYGSGFPFNRLERLQESYGVPLPAATQWDLVRGATPTLVPVYGEYILQAAQGRIIHNDDTTMRILRLTPQQRAAALSDDVKGERTGVFTSGIVSVGEEHRIALFFTGVRHAGENLGDVLKRRSQDLPVPIQMCDGLGHNLPKEFETLLCRCLAHGRRMFVDVAANFPEEVRFVLLTLKEVYKIDALARRDSLSPEERLRLHRKESAPLMEKLREWMLSLLAERKVEPNSGLGKAIRYMENHWEGLTQFLRTAGAPLDNNITERALKRAILHRKSALFYKTLNGARVGDIFMSLIYTAELEGVNAFDYLVTLLRHPREVAERPGQWMPWEYRATLARLSKGPDPPA